MELAGQEEEASWVAGEIERSHKAGRRWKDFAVLYRQHAHRDLLVEELTRRKIPFVISNLSILDHPLVRDVLCYLRLIAQPYDDVACVRVLAAPAWGLEPPDIVRLAERARKERKAIYDVLQLPQGELPFDASPAAVGTLLEFLGEQRKTMKRRDGAGDFERFDGMAGDCAASQRARPEVCTAAGGIRDRVGAKERDADNWRNFWNIWITISRRTA